MNRGTVHAEDPLAAQKSKKVKIMKTHNHNHEDHKTHVADETRALLAATAEATEGTIVEARNRLKAVLDSAGETYSHLKEKAVDSAKAADKKIRANPYQAIGLAFGVGALVGFLWIRRSRD